MQEGSRGRLTPTAVGWRVVVTAALTVGVWAGTAVGNDQWWPFAPMSQYAFLVQNGQAGIVNSPFMEARLTDGTLERVALSAQGLGIERSEIEGQLPSFIREPSRMQAIAILRARREPDAPRFTAVYLRNRQTRLDAARTEKIIDLASWQVRDPQDPESWDGRP